MDTKEWSILANEGAAHLDAVITLFGLAEDDSSTIDEALRFLAHMRRRDPATPVSVRVVQELRRRGLEPRT